MHSGEKKTRRNRNCFIHPKMCAHICLAHNNLLVVQRFRSQHTSFNRLGSAFFFHRFTIFSPLSLSSFPIRLVSESIGFFVGFLVLSCLCLFVIFPPSNCIDIEHATLLPSHFPSNFFFCSPCLGLARLGTPVARFIANKNIKANTNT